MVHQDKATIGKKVDWVNPLLWFSMEGMKKSVWLHNIRSAHNVGSIFRTAEGAGFDHVYLSGYTPLPIDRFGRKRCDLAKVSLGAEDSLSWSALEDPVKDIQALKETGAYLVCAEQDSRSIPLGNFNTPYDAKELILAVGEETEGITGDILDLADSIVEIPMLGEKESLNVSVAFGIAAYHISQ